MRWRLCAWASYEGEVSGALPLAAAAYVRTLSHRFVGFRFEGEGKTRISSTLGGYEVLYSASIDGHAVHGRDVMLLPGGQGAREGVVVEMLSAEAADSVRAGGKLGRPRKCP